MTVYYGSNSELKQLVDDLLSAYASLYDESPQQTEGQVEEKQTSGLLVKLFDDGKVLISRSDSLICHFCQQPIKSGDLNQHHLKPKSEGGKDTALAHKQCHIDYHSEQGHFKEWGRKGGLTTAALGLWIFNLKYKGGPPDPLRWIPFGYGQ